jgi:hypothetical protein
MSFFLKFSGFTLIPLMSLMSPFLLLPIVSRISDSATWASYTSGQTIGMLASAVVLWGWNISGPAAVMRAKDEADRLMLYRESLWSRVAVLVIVGPIVCLISAIVAAAPARLEAASMTLAMTVGGLTPSWYGVAIGSPRIVAVYDALPRLVAMLAAVPLLIVFRAVWIYPMLLTAALALSLWAFGRQRGHVRGSALTARAIFGRIKFQARSAVSIAMGAAYGAAPVPIATALLAIQQAAGFASVFQIYRVATFPVLALGNAFQSWVLGSEARPVLRRQCIALGCHAVMGGVGAVMFGCLGPAGSAILFGEAHRAKDELCWLFGVALFFLSLNTPLTRNLLIPSGGHGLFLYATTVSAICGTSVMIITATQSMSTGIALGFTLSEFLLFAVVVVPALIALKKNNIWVT